MRRQLTENERALLLNALDAYVTTARFALGEPEVAKPREALQRVIASFDHVILADGPRTKKTASPKTTRRHR